MKRAKYYNKEVSKYFFAVLLVVFVSNFLCFSTKALAAGDTSQLTPIMGQAQTTKEQMMKYFFNNNNAKSYSYVNSFITMTIEEGNSEGVKPDIAFALMMKETNFLKFTGTVQEPQNNFGGLGVTGEIDPSTGKPVTGLSFPDIRTGIRAVVQHLKGYATTQSLNNACVDPRYKYITKGGAQYVEWLGIHENPNHIGWAADTNYGYDIVNRVNTIKGITNTQIAARDANVQVSNQYIVGKTYTINGSGASSNKILYEYWIYDFSSNIWNRVKAYDEASSISWMPQKPGKYRIQLYIKDIYSSTAYDSTDYKDVVVSGGSAKNLSLTVGSGFTAGDSYNIQGNAVSDNKALYQYWVYEFASNKWTMVQDFSENAVFTWKPMKSGKFRIQLYAKDIYSSNVYDTTTYRDVDVGAAVAKNPSLTFNGDFFVGASNSITGKGESANKVLYEYWTYEFSSGKWTREQVYSENSVLNWIPKKSGKFRIQLYIKDIYSERAYDNTTYSDVVVNNVSMTMGNDFVAGKTYTINGNGGSTAKSLYEYWGYEFSTDKWNKLQPYSENKDFIWTPSVIGKYRVQMYVKGINSTNPYDSSDYRDIIIREPKASTPKITIGTGFIVGKPYTITGDALSDNTALYEWWLYNFSDNTWCKIQAFGTSNSVALTPAAKGNYRIQLYVKDSSSNKVYDDTTYVDFNVKPTKVIVLDAGHNYGGDDGAYATVGGTTYCERDLNMQLTLKLKTQLEQAGFTVILTRSENDTSKDDLTTSLQKRADIANNANADLFISLHHDKSTNSSTSGISVHYSTYKPGIDNSGVVEGNDPNGWYDGVNIDTTPSKAAIASRDLAYKLADGLSSSLGYNNLKAHDHNLYVTVHTNMPAILIENGFISNEAEAKRCADPNQQTVKAQTIAKIVNDYFSVNG